jgi:hypothetical protein
MVERDTFIEPIIPQLQWRTKTYQKRNYYTDNARLLHALPLVSTAQYLLSRGRTDEAKKFASLALSFKPESNTDDNGLSERDRTFIRSTDDKFSQIQAFVQRLVK